MTLAPAPFPEIDDLRGIGVTARDPADEEEIWDKTASGTGHQTIWPQLRMLG